jgi:hypothetical protein
MIKLLLLFILPFSLLHAAKILSYNIYDRTDRADVMITFDTPYDGVIKQSVTRNKIIIKLQNASIESPKIKKVSSRFLHSITITPMKNQTQIVASVPASVKLIASKTADAYGLRLRFASKLAPKTKQTQTLASKTKNKNTTFSNLPTKKEEGISTSYYIVVSILIICVIILFVIRKRMVQKGITPPQANPWSFQASKKTPARTQEASTQQLNQAMDNAISIRFQKPINEQNSVVMLDFGEQSYLVIIGKSNILLDKFTDDKPTTQEDFESILKNRHQELDDFLKVEEDAGQGSHSQASFASSHEALQAYKEKAGAISYEA